ncbi:MAG: hypothetical protein BWY42_00835 [Candidatus Omnitrophica bacterium ADurb.Bin277]|nr:MAG: hypothetical protein BWY42_00835 [Candidatus Omnitrophica bacterium ADurb.Bin277]
MLLRLKSCVHSTLRKTVNLDLAGTVIIKRILNLIQKLPEFFS